MKHLFLPTKHFLRRKLAENSPQLKLPRFLSTRTYDIRHFSKLKSFPSTTQSRKSAKSAKDGASQTTVAGQGRKLAQTVESICHSKARSHPHPLASRVSPVPRRKGTARKAARRVEKAKYIRISSPPAKLSPSRGRARGRKPDEGVTRLWLR